MRALLRGGLLVDGTGAAPTRSDVLIDGGVIVEVGRDINPRNVEVLELDGLVLSPGFIDIHTHYDAQVLWDRDLTPSSWHGVTTVVMGNCGFGIAPTRPRDRDTIIRTLENVEGMSAEALEAGIEWSFESFPQYLDAIDASPVRLNVAAMIGHSPLRLYAMGADADGPATPEQIAEMKVLVAEALSAGAIGFATSRSANHQGAWGKPVPSRHATNEEIFEIASALSDADRGVAQVTPGPGFATADLAELARRIGRPVTWTALLAGPGAPEKTTEILRRTDELGGEVWPQVACRPIVMQVTLEDPFPFATLPSFKEILAVPSHERAAIYGDDAWQSRARVEVEDAWGHRWPDVTVDETEEHSLLVGRSLDELALERRTSGFDVLVELSLQEQLQTRFRVVIANNNEPHLGSLLADRRVVLGLSDAGAHASQLCDASFSTHLLEHWVRNRGTISLEFAVWRLTGHAADVFRIGDRGRVLPGLMADLVVFDPATVGVADTRRVFDLPAGADRLVSDSNGVVHVFVNGEPIRLHGNDLDARPGRLIRGTSS